MKIALFVMTSAALLLMVTNAQADPVFPGEVFDISGTATQTGGSDCCTHGGTFGGSFTIGSEIDSSTDWIVTAFNPVCTLGIETCSSVAWDIPGLEFDASNGTLLGDASADYTGNGGDSRTFEFMFEDGNTTDDPYTDTDNTTPSNSRNGTISLSVTSSAPGTASRRCQNRRWYCL